MTLKEFDILATLAANPGRPFSRSQLIREVWGYEGGKYEQVVNNMIARIRKKIERDPAKPDYVKTIRGFGYRFVEPEELDD